MYCRNCGSEISGSGKFCTKCGSPVQKVFHATIEQEDAKKTLVQEERKTEQVGAVPAAVPYYTLQDKKAFSIETETAKKEKKSNKGKLPKERKRGKTGLLIALILFLCAVIAAGVLFLKWYMSTEQKAMRALNNGDYETARTILRSDRDASENESLIDTLKEQIADIETKFLSEEMVYATAKKTLDTIREMEVPDIVEALNKTTELVEKVNESRTHFDAAEEFLSAGDYENAIAQYMLVVEEDPDFEQANTNRSAAEEKFRKEVLQKAGDSALNEEYAEAIDILLSALEVLPNDASISKELEIYTSKLSDKTEADTLAEAETLAKKEDYLGAMMLVNELIKTGGETASLTAACKKYCDKYITQVLARVDELTAKKDFDGAIAALNAALKNVPDNEKLTKRLGEVNASKPVAITTLTPINGSWSWNEGNPVDPFGNDYTVSCNYAILEIYDKKTTSIEYRLYGKCRELTARIAPYTDISQDGEACVKIYADDTLVYTSPTITRKTDAIDISVPISGVDYILIEVCGLKEGGWSYSMYNDVIISNVQIWPE